MLHLSSDGNHEPNSPSQAPPATTAIVFEIQARNLPANLGTKAIDQVAREFSPSLGRQGTVLSPANLFIGEPPLAKVGMVEA